MDGNADVLKNTWYHKTHSSLTMISNNMSIESILQVLVFLASRDFFFFLFPFMSPVLSSAVVTVFSCCLPWPGLLDNQF